MQRVLRGVPTGASITLYADGTPSPADAPPPYRIVRGDGTELRSATASIGASSGEYVAELSPADTAALDLLTVEWSPSLGGTAHTYVSAVEVVGGFVFPLAAARAMRELSNEAKYSDALLATARTAAEQALEDACGVAFVPRYGRAVLDGGDRTDLLLPQPETRRITALAVDGAVVDVGEVGVYAEEGSLYRPAGWPLGRRNVEVCYEHGWTAAPSRISRAALLLVKRALIDSPVNDRATSIVTDDGRVESFITAGVRGALFDVPEANAAVRQYRIPRHG